MALYTLSTVHWRRWGCTATYPRRPPTIFCYESTTVHRVSLVFFLLLHFLSSIALESWLLIQSNVFSSRFAVPLFSQSSITGPNFRLAPGNRLTWHKLRITSVSGVGRNLILPMRWTTFHFNEQIPITWVVKHEKGKSRYGDDTVPIPCLYCH